MQHMTLSARWVELCPLSHPTTLTMPQKWLKVRHHLSQWERATLNPPPHPDSRRRNINTLVVAVTELGLLQLRVWISLTIMHMRLFLTLLVAFTAVIWNRWNQNRDLRSRVSKEGLCLKPCILNPNSINYISLHVC